MTYVMMYKLFKLLDECKVEHCVAWGYEKLPKVSGGDLDLYVYPGYFEKFKNLLIDEGYEFTKCIYSGENHKHGFFRKDDVTVDAFNTLCFSNQGKPAYLKLDELGYFRRRVEPNTYAWYSPTLELLFNLLRYYGGRRDVNIIRRIEKYLGECSES